MRIAVALLLSIALGDDWTDARDAAKAALKNPDPAARESAADKLGAFDKTESLELLVDLWGVSAQLLRQMNAEKAEKIRKLDAMPIKKKLQGGAVTLSGDEVAQHAEFKKLEEEIKQLEAKIGREEQARRAVRKSLLGLKSADTVRTLTRKISGETEWSIRAAAAEALAEHDSPDVKDALRKALKSEKDPRAVLSIVDAIARLRDRDAVPALGETLKKAAEWQVKATVIDALRRIADPRGIEFLIESLKDADGRLRDDANSALVAITGVDKHGDHATWKDWWATNRESILAGTYKKPDAKPNEKGGATTFYGIPIVSKRVLFILDRSGSMAEKATFTKTNDTPTGPGQPGPQGKPAGDRKIDVAKFELKNAILGLKEDVRFNVIFFNHGYSIWLEDAMELATAANKKKALEFVEACQPEGQTNIFDPTEKGFLLNDSKDPRAKADAEMGAFKGGVDTIYLMSDGMPNNGRITEPGAIVAKVTEMNKTRKIVIHTIAVGDQIRGDFMKELAERNGGKFVHRK